MFKYFIAFLLGELSLAIGLTQGYLAGGIAGFASYFVIKILMDKEKEKNEKTNS